MNLDGNKFFMPKKSLGDRHRAQAHKFFNLSLQDRGNRLESLEWAEQSARQAILYDYTNFQNWELLLKIKLELSDESGIYALLEDLLSVLGKDADFITQLKEINILPSCNDLFYSILKREPLDADVWWEGIKSGEYDLVDFTERCEKMDFRDRRSNIIFGRRLERLRKNDHDEVFSSLMPYLLAHRPDNFELWIELGKHYETLEDYKNALMCYDQVLEFLPTDENKSRLFKIINNKFKNYNNILPNKKEVMSFQKRLEKLASSIGTIENFEVDDEAQIDDLELKLISMIDAGNLQECFFMARSLISQGEIWAKKYFEICKERLLNE